MIWLMWNSNIERKLISFLFFPSLLTLILVLLSFNHNYVIVKVTSSFVVVAWDFLSHFHSHLMLLIPLILMLSLMLVVLLLLEWMMWCCCFPSSLRKSMFRTNIMRMMIEFNDPLLPLTDAKKLYHLNYVWNLNFANFHCWTSSLCVWNCVRRRMNNIFTSTYSLSLSICVSLNRWNVNSQINGWLFNLEEEEYYWRNIINWE